MIVLPKQNKLLMPTSKYFNYAVKVGEPELQANGYSAQTNRSEIHQTNGKVDILRQSLFKLYEKSY